MDLNNKIFYFLKRLTFWIYFFSPFIVWLLIYFQGPTYLVLVKKESFNSSIVIFSSFLWKLIIFLVFIQFINMFFYLLLKKKIFVIINIIF
ncbi:MAG: hypothetical protein C4278_02255, partial [Patescibacteria group bacterium]